MTYDEAVALVKGSEPTELYARFAEIARAWGRSAGTEMVHGRQGEEFKAAIRAETAARFARFALRAAGAQDESLGARVP